MLQYCLSVGYVPGHVVSHIIEIVLPMPNILTKKFSALVSLLNETNINIRTIKEGVIAHLELEAVEGGYSPKLTLSKNGSDGPDFSIVFQELVSLEHLKSIDFLDSISILDAVKASIHENDVGLEGEVNKGLAIGISKVAEISFNDRGDDIEFVIEFCRYTSVYRAYSSDIPNWAFTGD